MQCQNTPSLLLFEGDDPVGREKWTREVIRALCLLESRGMCYVRTPRCTMPLKQRDSLFGSVAIYIVGMGGHFPFARVRSTRYGGTWRWDDAISRSHGFPSGLRNLTNYLGAPLVVHMGQLIGSKAPHDHPVGPGPPPPPPVGAPPYATDPAYPGQKGMSPSPATSSSRPRPALAPAPPSPSPNQQSCCSCSPASMMIDRCCPPTKSCAGWVVEDHGSLPLGPDGGAAFWNFLFKNAADWGLLTFKLDHTQTQVPDMNVTQNDVATVDTWLTTMTNTAAKHGVYKQFGGCVPAMMLHSVTLPSATTARVGDEKARRGWRRWRSFRAPASPGAGSGHRTARAQPSKSC